MPAGRALSGDDLRRIEKAVANAETFSGMTFSVFVGVAEEDARGYAERLHGALAEPSRSVLVLCDPEFHALEIVTGREVRRWLTDVECGLAAATMQTSFVVGDIIGGLTAGIHQLGEAARHPRTLHTIKPSL